MRDSEATPRLLYRGCNARRNASARASIAARRKRLRRVPRGEKSRSLIVDVREERKERRRRVTVKWPRNSTGGWGGHGVQCVERKVDELRVVTGLSRSQSSLFLSSLSAFSSLSLSLSLSLPLRLVIASRLSSARSEWKKTGRQEKRMGDTARTHRWVSRRVSAASILWPLKGDGHESPEERSLSPSPTDASSRPPPDSWSPLAFSVPLSPFLERLDRDRCLRGLVTATSSCPKRYSATAGSITILHPLAIDFFRSYDGESAFTFALVT